MLQEARALVRTSSVCRLVSYAVTFFVVVAFFVGAFIFREEWQETLKNVSATKGGHLHSSHGNPGPLPNDKLNQVGQPKPLNHNTAFDHNAPLDVSEPGAWPFAYAMFLAEGYNYSADPQIDTPDVYFDSARTVIYQLLHAPSTRTNHSIEVVVLVTEDVPKWKRDRLLKDGAKVQQVDKIRIEWLDKVDLGRWADVIAKIHVFELTQYEKICFIDTDMLIRGHLDGLFADPAAQLQRPGHNETEIKDDEGPLPESFIFAGVAELATFEHEIPPDTNKTYMLNAGFFVIKPSVAAYEFYLRILNLPYRFWPSFPEQAMLNYVHRPEGNMPWRRLHWSWNVGFATYKDVQAGGRSFHGKYWMGPDSEYDAELSRLWEYQRAEMQAYYAAR